MAISSIHIKKAKDGSVGHNSREHFSYSIVFPDGKNEYNATIKEAYTLYRFELQKRSEAYTKRTGQKLQKKAVTQLSAIVNLEEHHTLEDLEPIKAELEAKFGTKVYQMAIHRDEGKLISKADGTEFYSGIDFFLNHDDKQLYFDKKFTNLVPLEEYETQKNYHAHIEMLGLDEDGNAIRQKMNKVALKALQTFTAKALKMQRGKENASYTQEQMREIIAIVGKKSDYESTTLYAQRFNEVAKDLGYFVEKRKRKDTHDYKDAGANREQAKRDTLAKQVTEKDLKEEIAKLREELKTNHAERKDYAQLEQLNRDLKAQIKDKSLTIESLHQQIDALKQLTNILESKNEALHEEIVKKDEIINSTPNESALEIQHFVEEELQVQLTHDTRRKQFSIRGIVTYLIKKVQKLTVKVFGLESENKKLRAENNDLRRFKSQTVNGISSDSLIDEYQKEVQKALDNAPDGSVSSSRLRLVLDGKMDFSKIKSNTPEEMQIIDNAKADFEALEGKGLLTCNKGVYTFSDDQAKSVIYKMNGAILQDIANEYNGVMRNVHKRKNKIKQS